MDKPKTKLIELTPEMLIAGADVLAHWKCESDYVSEKQAVKEIFEAMLACHEDLPFEQTRINRS